ncbi:F-box protein [Quillaja saponaria]|uniref:F-box protein n=1 Tax=Quillaja saponaria TaxID=32244 RepID=A0AAD7PPB8_QUISA|nr:F-box protein [Quillaja saponaria]
MGRACHRRTAQQLDSRYLPGSWWPFSLNFCSAAIFLVSSVIKLVPQSCCNWIPQLHMPSQVPIVKLHPLHCSLPRTRAPQKASDDDGVPLSWGENDRVILSFNMSDEVFQKSPLPPKSGTVYDECVLVINDSIAFVELFRTTEYEWIDIWEMNETDVERTWTKKLRITVHNGLQSLFLGLRRDGKFFLDNGLGELLIYDANRQALMNSRIYGTLHSLQIITYNESLVSFRRGIEFEHHHD